MLLRVLCLVLFCNSVYAQATKAPAYPLITHNTYFSIWSFGDTLNASPTKHWTGKDQPLLGYLKVDNELYRFMGKEQQVYKTILPASDEKAYQCKYLIAEPAAGWQKLQYNDSGWQTGTAPFTDDKTQAKTLWNSKDIWMRRTFTLNDPYVDKLVLKLWHDDDVEVYLNGDKIYSKIGWTSDFELIPLADDVRSKLKKGNNILAIHCANTAGGAWLDAGLIDQVKTKISTEVKPAKQMGVEVAATQTTYKLRCGKADLLLTFTSPLLLTDMDVFERPVSYITYRVRSNDGKNHTAKVFFAASTNIAVNKPMQQVAAEAYTSGRLSILKAGTTEQPILKKER